MITTKEVSRRIEEFSNKCKEKKFPLTPQKTAIFSFLAGTTSHPTAEEIYGEMQKQFPTLSFATVYKNLQKLKDLLLIREIRVGGQKSRFDARMDDHSHLIYPNGTIVDAELDTKKIPVPVGIHPKDIKKISVHFYLS